MKFKLRSRPFKKIKGYMPGVGKFTKFSFFSFDLFSYFRINGKIRKIQIFPQRNLSKWMKESASVFYLKVNRDTYSTYKCLQVWLDVCWELRGIPIIICDNKRLEKNILTKNCFHDPRTQIITSYIRPFASFIKNIASERWINAANAHLSTLYHARIHGVSRFWNIDADDTLFLFPVNKISTLLKKVEEVAIQSGINLYSLDMWKSRSGGKHWSWGVTFVNDTVNILNLISSEKDLAWAADYAELFSLSNANSDWHINSLVSRRKKITIKVFYPKNGGFIHWGDFIFNPIGAYVCQWKNNVVEYPLMNAMRLNEFSSYPISVDCDEIDVNISNIDFRESYVFNGTWLSWSDPDVAKFFGIDKLNEFKDKWHNESC